MMWVLKTFVKTDGKENIYSFTLKIFVYLNLCPVPLHSSYASDDFCYLLITFANGSELVSTDRMLVLI